MKTYRPKKGNAFHEDEATWLIWKHIGPLMDREVHCVYKDTCERTARAVLRDLEKYK